MITTIGPFFILGWLRADITGITIFSWNFCELAFWTSYVIQSYHGVLEQPTRVL